MCQTTQKDNQTEKDIVKKKQKSPKNPTTHKSQEGSPCATSEPRKITELSYCHSYRQQAQDLRCLAALSACSFI